MEGIIVVTHSLTPVYSDNENTVCSQWLHTSECNSRKSELGNLRKMFQNSVCLAVVGLRKKWKNYDVFIYFLSLRNNDDKLLDCTLLA